LAYKIIYVAFVKLNMFNTFLLPSFIMEISQQDKDAYKAMMAELQNLAYYANAAWIFKYGEPILKENARAVPRGFEYPKVVEKVAQELEEATKKLLTMTDEELQALDKPPSTPMPHHLKAIPEEMRDLMDVLVLNMESFKDQRLKDTTWLASAANEELQPDRLKWCIRQGYLHVDFEDIWRKVEQLKTRRLLAEARGS